MAKSSNQKLKMLIIRDFLLRMSDQDHPVTVQQIIDELESFDIKAERKSIYDDLDALKLYGMDIIRSRGNYYVGERSFQAAELKLLVDSIQSSKFITQRKTMSLIKKLEGLCSIYDAQLLEREVYVRNRVKSMNESVYYNVDRISGAISRDRAIRFKYFDYDLKMERRLRRNGGWYKVSPFALMWDDENYYMLAWEGESSTLRHYRVDKMLEITQMKISREGKEAFAQVDMSSYSKKIFSMFTGDEKKVKLRFANSLAGAVFDRFGTDIMAVPDGDGHFTVSMELAVSPRFYAWLFGFGTDAEIIEPEELRRDAARMARDIEEMYGQKN
ncbi:MAG: WYL domain-containing protein [Oscillospiraceae bacterium]|nr:WYL domain-containing protein [Oscillospiraceae bacterium]